MTVKLASTLPEGANNGLQRIARELVAEPTDTHIIVAVVDCSKITSNVDSGDEVPTVRVRQVEVIPAGERRRYEATLNRLHDERTGKRPLFDVDGNSGEILANG